MTDRLTQMIAGQLDLQAESYGKKNDSLQRQFGDPRFLKGEDLADFITWNCMALVREVGEALEEHRWKPWLTDGSRGGWYDRDRFVKELVDAWHFFMNLLLAAGVEVPEDADGKSRPPLEPEEIATEFFERYFVKRATNAKRQAEGYDGVKDADGRELDDPDRDVQTWNVLVGGDAEHVVRSAKHSYAVTGRHQRVVFKDGRGTIWVPARD